MDLIKSLLTNYRMTIFVALFCLALITTYIFFSASSISVGYKLQDVHSKLAEIEDKISLSEIEQTKKQTVEYVSEKAEELALSKSDSAPDFISVNAQALGRADVKGRRLK